MAKNFSNREDREADVFPKSVGVSALNENQIPDMFEWTYNEDTQTVEVVIKDGYSLEGTGGGGGTSDQPLAGVFYENDTNVSADYTITAGKNAMSAGPITIDAGVTVTVPVGSVWTIV